MSQTAHWERHSRYQQEVPFQSMTRPVWTESQRKWRVFSSARIISGLAFILPSPILEHPVSNLRISLPISFPDLRQEVIIEERVCIVIWLPVPFRAGEGIIHVFRPGIHDSLSPRVGLKLDLRARKCLNCTISKFTGRQREGRDVIDLMVQFLAWYIQ